MTIIKTSELTGAALDWAVAKCEGEIFESRPTVDPQIAKVWPLTGLARVENGRRVGYAVADARFRKTVKSYADEGGICLCAPVWQPSTDWAQGGPIIEREMIQLTPHCMVNPLHGWAAAFRSFDEDDDVYALHRIRGKTPLIAAMRCYVASKLGDKIEIPEEFIK